MTEIIIKTQKEFDKLPNEFSEYTYIYIKSKDETIIVNKAWENSRVEARENSSVVAWGNSSVVAWGNSRVEARENSRVEAWENSRVEARENSSVVARENSSVVARENSRVEAWENSRVEARENSSVVAWGNSRVEARENSSVVAWGNVSIHIFSEFSTILLWGFAVAIVSNKIKATIKKMSKNAYVQIVKELGWFENNGIKKTAKIVLYKKVSKDWQTQENTKNETLWKVGTVVEHQNYNPKDAECGEGKFHACSKPYFCDEFRNEPGDRYVALEVVLKDTYEWKKNPTYPHKIGFRKCKVLFECDKFGEKLKK
jgi:hypothetical protein